MSLLPRSWTMLALVPLLLTTHPARAITFEDPTSFQEGATWAGADLGIPGYLGALMFSADGATLYVVGDSETSSSAVYAVPVTRDATTQQVTDLGPAADVTLVFSGDPNITGGIDAGMEIGPDGTLFYTYYSGNMLAERPGGIGGVETAYPLDVVGVATSVSGMAFSPHVVDPGTGFGQLQVSSWDNLELYNIPLTDLGGGLFEPGTAEVLVTLHQEGPGAIQYIPYGPLAGHLMHADWDYGELRILEIDPATGWPIDQGTGLPTLGTADPVDDLFASDLDVGPWGLEFDPVTGEAFVATWNGDPANSIVQIVGDGFCSDLDGDGWTDCQGDCDEADPSTYPNAAELCDGLDNNCNGVVPADEVDADADGWMICDNDCDDADAAVNPGATEVACDFLDNDCDGALHDEETDWDGDGYTECDGECAPDDPGIFPGATEIPCDYLDNDCDGLLHPEEVDDDVDGYDECDGDCDDTLDTVYPGAVEVACDFLDNDCDGWLHADEEDADLDGVSVCEGDCDDIDPLVFPGALEACDALDNDCDGDVDEDFDADGDGWTTCGGECDDNDPTVYPGAPEDCDLVDDDCDGAVDEDFDLDGDGWTTCSGDCDDADPAIHPAAPDPCDGVDNDCDGEVDEDADPDQDGDGFSACDGDCDENDPDTYPGADELCDGVDNDCDGDVDEDGACGDDDDDDSAGDDDDSAGDDDDTSGDDDDVVGDDDDTVADDDDASADDDDSAPGGELDGPGDCECHAGSGARGSSAVLLVALLGWLRRR